MLALLVTASIIGAASNADDNGAPVSITFWHAMGGPLGEVLNSMIAEFESHHPKIKIQSVSMGDYGALAQKLMSALWVRSPPTIAQVYQTWATQFLEAGELFPLESLVNGPDGLTPEELADIYPALIEDNSWNGLLVTLPFNKSVPVFFYNKLRFDSLGLEFPKTWSEFRTTAKKLTKRAPQLKDWIWGTGGGVNAPLFASMLFSHRGELMDETTVKPLFASQAGIDVLQYQVDMIYRDSSQVFSVGYSGQDDLLAGRLGMIYGSIVSKSFMRGKEKFPIAIAPLPYWDEPAATIYGTNIALFRKATPAQRQAAWTFIKWFTRPEQQAHWAARTFYVPACISALQIPEYKIQLDTVLGLRQCVAQLNHARFEPKSRVWFEGRKFLESGMEPALRGILSPEQALTEAAGMLAPAHISEGRTGFFVLIAVLFLATAAGIVVIVRKSL